MGKKPSKENVIKMKLATSSPIIMCDKNGNMLQRFYSASEAARYLGNKVVASITQCANGVNHRKTAYGYKWKWDCRPNFEEDIS